MKLSVSIPDDDVVFLDEFAAKAGMESRSAVVQQAIAMLKAAELVRDYAKAFDEWAESGDAATWDTSISDGLPG
ncbi:MAG: ribbon-helix-helix domain-containing protein [Actinomycetes bacterium]